MAALAPAERLAELAGPIVVKEVRQGLRGRVFAIFFGLLLVACFALALVAFADTWGGVSGRSVGRQYFGAYLTALGLAWFFVLPFVAYRSMVRELEDETWVLVALTGLGARSVVRGKWASAMSQAVLFASACAPFVLFSYFLNGVDLVQVGATLVLATSWCALLVSLSVALACQAHTRLWRAVAQFLVLGLLLAATTAGVAFSWFIALEGGRAKAHEALGVLVVLVPVVAGFTTALLLEAGAASLALPTEAPSRGPRQHLALGVIASLAVAAALFVAEGGDATVAALGQLFTVFSLAIAGVFAVSERDGWSRHTPRAARWLEPGAWRSAQLVLGLLALSTLVWGALFVLDAWPSLSSSEAKRLRFIAGAPAYAVLYLSLGVLLGRRSPLRASGEPVATRVGVVLALAFGFVASTLLAVATTQRMDRPLPNALNPVFGLLGLAEGRGRDVTTLLVILFATTLVAALAAAVTLRARHREHAA